MFNKVSTFFKEKTPDALEWLSVVLLHAATVPTLLAGMANLTDKMPPVDIVMFIWFGLLTMFMRACIQRNYTMMVTIGLGFFVQAFMMALLFFK